MAYRLQSYEKSRAKQKNLFFFLPRRSKFAIFDGKVTTKKLVSFFGETESVRVFAAKKRKGRSHPPRPFRNNKTFPYPSNAGGSVGMAPFCVQTKAETSTAFL